MEKLEEVWDRLQLNKEENVPIETNLEEEFRMKVREIYWEK